MDIVPLWGEESTMPKSRPPYPPEFRQRIIELVRKGRTPESLAEAGPRVRPRSRPTARQGAGGAGTGGGTKRTSSGPLTFGTTTAQVFCRSREGLASPDLQLLFAAPVFAQHWPVGK